MKTVYPRGWGLLHNTRNTSRNVRQGKGLCIAYDCNAAENLALQILVQLARVKLMLLQTENRYDRKPIYLNCCTIETSIIFKSQPREKWLV